jgi:type VI secretion system secreted protein VgrG
MKKLLLFSACGFVFYLIGYAQTMNRIETISATNEIILKTGQSSIHMKRDGTITITGAEIIINASKDVEIKTSKSMIMKGGKILQN